MDFMWLLLGALLILGGLAYFIYAPKGDVRKVDAAKQERPKAAAPTAKQAAHKTAQLSALRERLDQGQTPPRKPAPKAEAAKPVEKEKAWRPEDAGLAESEAVVEALASKPEPIVAPVMAPVVTQDAVAVAQPLAAPRLAAVAEPVAEPVAAPKEVAIEPPKPAVAEAVPAAGAQILLVDDSKVVRVKTEKLLLSKGYSVTTAVDGIDALSKLDTLKPQLIITDIEMPNLDGFGLVRNVRGNPRTAEIPVIVMTSHVNLHLDIAATEGINGFLPKPFVDQDLLDQVAFLCES